VDVDPERSSLPDNPCDVRAAAGELLPPAALAGPDHDLGDLMLAREPGDGPGRVVVFYLVPARVDVRSQVPQPVDLTTVSPFVGLITLWLLATVLFANFAEAVAEGRGKAQADTLRRSRRETMAYLLRPDGTTEEVPSTVLRAGNLAVIEAGQVIPGDGDVVEGMAVIDESAVTGESAPVIRESGGDRSAVTGGTVVLSDRIVVKITSNPGETFLDRMIALVEGASRQKTPNEVALDILIAGLALILLVAVVTLQPFAIYSKAIQSTAVLVALFICLAPTTIGGLLSAIGIAGMDRMVQRNVLAMSGRAVEAAGDCSTLLLDKTGTITYGNRLAAEFIPAEGVTEAQLAEAVLLSSLADETPEGRSIVDLAETRYGLAPPDLSGAELVPFTAQTRMSGVDLAGRRIRKGAADSVRQWVEELGGTVPADVPPVVERIANSGGTPLVVADGSRVLGVIHLKDTVKQGMIERFKELRDMGIRTIMITGDNPLTAAAIAREAGVDDVAKYFAIIPAMFVVVYPALGVLNVMRLDNPHTAILAAVIYNALIIPALIPLALRGVKFRPLDGAAILRRNGLIYGIGGIIAPFIFIKLIDLVLTAIGIH
jgi:K+-transporting ATPase B subunit